MKNKELAEDYLLRAEHRLAAVKLLFERKSFADVVRESQEIVELVLKALLRVGGIEVPRLHDVGPLLLEHQHLLPQSLHIHLSAFAKISKGLRRDRELSFYGSEDLTPSDFYEEEDARKALEDSTWVFTTCRAAF